MMNSNLQKNLDGKRILANGHFVDNNTHKTLLNNNDLIIGPSGAGKTRGYVLPNILCSNESFIVVDTKHSLYKSAKTTLEKKGYTIYNIDFTDITHCTVGYNMFDCVRYNSTLKQYEAADILAIAESICPIENSHDPFWDLAAKQVLVSMIAYILEELPYGEHHLASLIKLITGDNFNFFIANVTELAEIRPHSLAVQYLSVLKNGAAAEKMIDSIKGIVCEKILKFAYNIPVELSLRPREERIDIPKIGQTKTAVFLNISDVDHSGDTIVSLFYTQALQQLCRLADNNPNNRLAVPVRLILDDFASGTKIPEFDKIISVIRSRDIYVSIIIQSLSQLESFYSQADSKTIINNCDHLLYLGGHDMETVQMMSLKAGKTRDHIINMPVSQALLVTRGTQSKFVKRFDVSQLEMAF